MLKEEEISYLDILRSYADVNPPTSTINLPDKLSEIKFKATVSPSDADYAIDQAENNILEPKIESKKRKTRPKTVILSNQTNDYTIDKETAVYGFDYTSKEEDDSRFLRKLAKLNQIANTKGNLLPEQIDVLRYIDNLSPKSAPAWYKSSLELIAETSLRYPRQPALYRSYLKQFMREPLDAIERPCSHPYCKSVEMGGFRCRELILPGQKDKPVIHGWCYICHLNETNKLYFQSLHNPDIVADKDDQVYSIHNFIVFTDRIGEYRLDKTIQGNVKGIFGPFPIFNVHNYMKVKVSERKYGWRESDSLLFRLPPKVSSPTQCYRINQQVQALE